MERGSGEGVHACSPVGCAHAVDPAPPGLRPVSRERTLAWRVFQAVGAGRQTAAARM